MTLYQLKIWYCNDCKATHVEDHKGPPKSWFWFRDPKAKEKCHRCGPCEAKAPPELKGVPLGYDSIHQKRKT